MLARNILIFHSGALGDFVLNWPLAMALGRLYPQSRVIYVTHEQKGRLAEKVLGVEWSGIEAGWHCLFGDPAALPPAGRKLLDGARHIFSFVSAPDDDWTENARALAPQADMHVLQPTPPADADAHATQHLLRQLEPLPAIHESVRQMLQSIERRGARPRGNAAGPVLLHPGSGSREKCWPADCFAQLAARLRTEGLKVRLLFGEVELDRWGEQAIKRVAGDMDAVCPQDYLQLHDQLAGASAYIGNDSGPSHLAGMLALPTFCVFGPTEERIWRPLGPAVHTLRHQPLDGLCVEEVHAWFRQHIPVSE